MFLLLLTFYGFLLASSSSSEVTCKDQQIDCYYRGNDTSVTYICDNNYGICHCGVAKECHCGNVNGDCFCGDSTSCTCKNTNGDCHCGSQTSRCQCSNTNGDCICGMMWMLCLCGNTHGRCRLVTGAMVLTAIGSTVGFCICVFLLYRFFLYLKHDHDVHDGTVKNEKESPNHNNTSLSDLGDITGDVTTELSRSQHQELNRSQHQLTPNLETVILHTTTQTKHTQTTIKGGGGGGSFSPTCRNTNCNCTVTRQELLGGEPLEKHLECPYCKHPTAEHKKEEMCPPPTPKTKVRRTRSGDNGIGLGVFLNSSSSSSSSTAMAESTSHLLHPFVNSTDAPDSPNFLIHPPPSPDPLSPPAPLSPNSPSYVERSPPSTFTTERTSGTRSEPRGRGYARGSLRVV